MVCVRCSSVKDAMAFVNFFMTFLMQGSDSLATVMIMFYCGTFCIKHYLHNFPICPSLPNKNDDEDRLV